MKTSRSIPLIIAFLIIVLIGWAVLFVLPGPDGDVLDDTKNPVDLTSTQLDDKVYFFHDYWDSYPGELYTPEDLEDPKTAATGRIIEGDDKEIYREIDYATHVATFKLEPNKNYGINMRTGDYATRIYINGELTDTIGNPSESESENIPRVAERTYYFKPAQELTTIVIQVSNYVHNEGSYPPSFTIGYDNNITDYTKQVNIITFLVVGALFTAFLNHLGLFLLNTRHKALLFFSLSCLLLMFQGNKLIPTFDPDYNWQFAIRFEYIDHFAIFLMLTLFLRVLFADLIDKRIAYIYYSICTLFILLTIALTPKIFTGLIIYFEIISIIYIVYIIIRLILKLREKKLQNTLAFVGVFAISAAGVYDILHTFGIAPEVSLPGIDYVTPLGMLFFVFCYTLVLSMDYAEKDRVIAEAERQVTEAESKYAELLKKNEDMDPAKKLSDFGLSKREMDVAFLLLNGKMRVEIAKILGISMGSVNTYCGRIYQKSGCNSLPELVKLLGLSDNLKINHEDDPK